MQEDIYCISIDVLLHYYKCSDGVSSEWKWFQMMFALDSPRVSLSC